MVFLYAKVLERPLGEVQGVVRSARKSKIPVVLSQEEVARVLAHLSGVYWLIGCLQYGSGLRLLESLRLRVKDLDFDHRAIVVRSGKGWKDRVVTLPDDLLAPLQRHLESRSDLFEQDRRAGYGTVHMPYALERKYPNASSQWGWQYVFPASRIGTCPRSGARRRHHVDESAVQKVVRRAVVRDWTKSGTHIQQIP